MRVLKEHILVSAIKVEKSELVIEEDDTPRKGKVIVSATEEIKVGEEVLFGDRFENLKDWDETKDYLLMHKSNIKLIGV